MNIKRVFFEDGFLCVQDEGGEVLRQSLDWYPRLLRASDSERNAFATSVIGLHWRTLDTDVSFESFRYPKGTTALMYMG